MQFLLFGFFPYVFITGHFLPSVSAVAVIESEQSLRLCVSVCLRAFSQLNRLTYDHDFWYGTLTLARLGL